MAANKVLKFVILGPPGSGKGTISKWFCKDFKLAYLSTGDLLRKEILEKSEIGEIANNYIKKGELVPNELATSVTFNALKTISLDSSWLLDGYPRTLKQGKLLTENVKLTKVINLLVPNEEIINRIKSRLIHPASGRIYNLQFNPPKKPFIDDITGEPLIQREDDKEEAVKQRLKDYNEKTEPIRNYFSEKSLLVEFEGLESKQIYPKIENYIKSTFF